MHHRKHHRNNVSFQDIVKTEGLKLLKYAEGVAKAKVGPMNADQQVKVTLFMGKYHGGGLSQAPMSNLVQSVPVSMGETQSN